MMALQRAERIAMELLGEAKDLRDLAAKCHTASAARYFIARSVWAEEKAAELLGNRANPLKPQHTTERRG